MNNEQSGGLVRVTTAAAVMALITAAALATGVPALAAPPGAAPQPPPAGDIATFAGGAGGPAAATKVSLVARPSGPCGVTFGAGGLYVADTGAVHEISLATGGLTTPAGTQAAGPLGDGGPAASAALTTCGAAVDSQGNLVIADKGDNRIRVVAASTGTFYGQAMTAGDIYTIAGDGTAGFSGDGGPATAASLNDPNSVVADDLGNLVIADTHNNRIRVVAGSTGTFYGQAMTAGDIYTIAGDGRAGFSGDGGPATAANLSGPASVAVNIFGNLLIAVPNSNRVRVVPLGSGTFFGIAMTSQHIYTVAGDGTAGFSGNGAPGPHAELNRPSGVAADGFGNLVIADTHNNRIRVVAARRGTFYGQAMLTGKIYSVAGNGMPGFFGDTGSAGGAELDLPTGVTVDDPGNLVIADSHNDRVRVVAVTSGTFYGQAMTAGDIYTVAGNGNGGFSGNGGPATSAEFTKPEGVGVDGNGNTLIAQAGGSRVLVVAAATGRFYGRPMTAGDLYIVAGDGGNGFSGDGGQAIFASLNSPESATTDPSGNLVIADTGNHRVRVVAERTGTFYGQAMTAGNIYTVVGDGGAGLSGDGGPATSAQVGPAQVSVDGSGNLVIADFNNDRIRVVAETSGTFYGQAMTAGDIYTVAGGGFSGLGDGGPATSAELGAPEGVTVDPSGNLVITALFAGRVRVVAVTSGTFYGQAMTAGDIYTVAGGGSTLGGDGGPATATGLVLPMQTAIGRAGTLLISESGENRLRAVAVTSGTFYGQAMAAGDIYTVAGDGNAGFTGDGGPASGAELNGPLGVATNVSGDVFVADLGNHRIREVAP